MSRCIDADALDKFLEDAEIEARKMQRYVMAGALNTIRGNLRTFPTITTEPDWTPLSKEMPEPGDEVLTTYAVNGNHSKRFVETAVYYDDDDGGFWHSPWDEYRVPGTKIDVLAWKPLSEPYREGGECPANFAKQ